MPDIEYDADEGRCGKDSQGQGIPEHQLARQGKRRKYRK